MQAETKTGPGVFQWNAGAWFGSFMGANAHLLVGAILFAGASNWLAWLWGVCFAASIIATIGLWRRRFVMEPYPAMQWGLFVSAIALGTAWVSLYFGRPDLARWLNASPTMALLVPLIVPALMVQFHIKEMSFRSSHRVRKAEHDFQLEK